VPLLDHFHPPLHGPRRWEGFHSTWASQIAEQLNQELLPPGYYAEPNIHLGTQFEAPAAVSEKGGAATAVWAPPQASLSVPINFAQLDVYEVLIYQDIGGAELRAAVELVSPANKDRASHRQILAVKCAGYLKHAVSVVLIDEVTTRVANLHAEILQVLEAQCTGPIWQAPTNLYSVAYRAVNARGNPHLEAWTETLALGRPLPTVPLFLDIDLCLPLRLDESYVAACTSLLLPG
jgi:hypothetical protein